MKTDSYNIISKNIHLNNWNSNQHEKLQRSPRQNLSRRIKP